MAIDSNAMKGRDGRPLRHLTPYPTPLSSGVNVFAKDLDISENPFVFHPVSLVLAVLNFIMERKVPQCTCVLPASHNAPLWTPLVKVYSKQSFFLSRVGQKR